MGSGVGVAVGCGVGDLDEPSGGEETPSPAKGGAIGLVNVQAKEKTNNAVSKHTRLNMTLLYRRFHKVSIPQPMPHVRQHNYEVSTL